MLYFIYNVLLIALLPPLFLFFVVRAFVFNRDRRGFCQNWGFRFPKNSSRPLWIHAISAGEVVAALPIIKRIAERHPDLEIVLSVNNDAGWQMAQRTPEVRSVFYFPLDLWWIVRRALSSLFPRAIVVMETELWPNFYRAARRQNIPLIIVNGRIPDRVYLNYRLTSFFFRRVLKNVSRFSMQSELDADRIISIGADPAKVIVTGNTKFNVEGQKLKGAEIDELRTSLGIPRDRSVFVVGSTHRGEEGIILKEFSKILQAFPDLLMILAPRHRERTKEVENIILRDFFKYILRSRIDPGRDNSGIQIILLDTMGELAKIYSLATVVFIAGSLVPVGGHSILEPALYAKPIVIGPYTHAQRESVELFMRNSAIVKIRRNDELSKAVVRLLGDEKMREDLGRRALEVLQANSGSPSRNVELIEDFL
ncbi:MAG: 3-deoxy-D-manno-octulosonic acid transferase [bacterium]